MNNTTTCTSSLNVPGVTTLQGNVDCGGGIAITGSNAFSNDGNVDASNKTNTYINFKDAGSANDWCYLWQIGGPNTYKLALDFHDGNDTRFCIRKVQSTNNPDTITEVSTIDNGNVSYTGTLYVSGTTTLNDITAINDSLNVSGNTTLNDITTINSSLNVSGTTILNNATTCLSSLNVVGNIIGSGTALSNLNYGSILNPQDLTP